LLERGAPLGRTGGGFLHHHRPGGQGLGKAGGILPGDGGLDPRGEPDGRREAGQVGKLLPGRGGLGPAFQAGEGAGFFAEDFLRRGGRAFFLFEGFPHRKRLRVPSAAGEIAGPQHAGGRGEGRLGEAPEIGGGLGGDAVAVDLRAGEQALPGGGGHERMAGKVLEEPIPEIVGVQPVLFAVVGVGGGEEDVPARAFQEGGPFAVEEGEELVPALRGGVDPDQARVGRAAPVARGIEAAAGFEEDLGLLRIAELQGDESAAAAAMDCSVLPGARVRSFCQTRSASAGRDDFS